MIALALATRNRTNYIINHNTFMNLNKKKDKENKDKNKVFNKLRYLNK